MIFNEYEFYYNKDKKILKQNNFEKTVIYM